MLIPPLTQACVNEKMHERLLKTTLKLDISKEQKAQIKAIHTEAKQKLVALREDFKQVRHEINETFKLNQMTVLKKNAFIHTEKELLGLMIMIELNERSKINQLLSEEQRVQLSHLLEHPRQHHKPT